MEREQILVLVRFNTKGFCSDINGCNEIVIPGVNGLLVPVKDVDALTNSMIRLYEDKDLRKSMIHNSRKTIIERYS